MYGSWVLPRTKTSRPICFRIYFGFISKQSNNTPSLNLLLAMHFASYSNGQTPYAEHLNCSWDAVTGTVNPQLNWAILLSDFISDRKTEQTAQFWQAIAQTSELSFPVVFHTQNCAVHSGNPTVSSVHPLTPRWHAHEKKHRTDQKKLTNLMGNLYCAREHSVQFLVEFFT